MRRSIATLVTALALAALALAPAPQAGAAGQRPVAAAAPRPLIFVHGSGGSGAQFESQAMRFTSNGYPDDRLAVHEYDSTFGIDTIHQVGAGLSALNADTRHSTGA